MFIPSAAGRSPIIKQNLNADEGSYKGGSDILSSFNDKYLGRRPKEEKNYKVITIYYF